MPRRLGDLQVAADLSQGLTLSQELLALCKLPDHLFGCVPALLRRTVRVAPFWGIGLAQRVAHLMGTRSRQRSPGGRRLCAVLDVFPLSGKPSLLSRELDACQMPGAPEETFPVVQTLSWTS